MPEMLKPTSLIMGAGLGLDVACLTDGRFSGGYVISFLLSTLSVSDPSFHFFLSQLAHDISGIKKTCYIDLTDFVSVMLFPRPKLVAQSR